jgi:hypothetical protein
MLFSVVVEWIFISEPFEVLQKHLVGVLGRFQMRKSKEAFGKFSFLRYLEWIFGVERIFCASFVEFGTSARLSWSFKEFSSIFLHFLQ